MFEGSHSLRAILRTMLSWLAIIALFGMGMNAQVLKGRKLNGAYRMYRGAARSLQDVAILTTSPTVSKDQSVGVSMIVLDGVYGPDQPPWESYGLFNRDSEALKLEMAPGPHALLVKYNSTKREVGFIKSGTGRPQVLLFNAKPGKLYRIDADSAPGGWLPRIVEVGPIPNGYSRPAASCENFEPSKSRCLEN